MPGGDGCIGTPQLAEAAKDIRARSMLRSRLAELGSTDERFLGPEWILVANDIVANMRGDSTAESALDELAERTGAVRWAPTCCA